MSRVGNSPVALPEKVEVTISADQISVKGPLGTLAQSIAPNVKVEKIDQAVMLESLTSIKRAGADLILTYFAKDAARIMTKQN